MRTWQEEKSGRQGRAESVTAGWSYTFGCHLWSITEQTHCIMNSVWIWKFPLSITLVLSKLLYNMVVATQVNCKATSQNFKNSHIFFKTNPSGLKLCRGFYLSSQIWYVINLLEETLSILNCDAPFGSRLDQAKKE